MATRQISLVLTALALSMPAHAQQNLSADGIPQTAAKAEVSWPAVALIGMPVLLEGGEQVGLVTDVLVQDNGVASLKLDISRALGHGRSITIGFSEIKFSDERSASGRVSRFAPTDRTGGARLADPALSSPSAPPAATSPNTRAATNRTVDVDVPSSIGAEPGNARKVDPRGADSMVDVRSRSADPRYVGSTPSIGNWGGPARGVIRLNKEELIRRADQK